jgi:hypothetical protein
VLIVGGPTRVALGLVLIVGDLTRVARDLGLIAGDLTRAARDLGLTVAGPTRIALAPVHIEADRTHATRGLALIVGDLTHEALAPVVTAAGPTLAAMFLVLRALAPIPAGRLPMRTRVALNRAAMDLVLIADDLIRIEPAPPVSVEAVILVPVNPALRGAHQDLAELAPAETVQIPTRAELGPVVATAVDLTHAAPPPALTVADPTRVAAGPVVLTRIAVLTARLILIALARRLIETSLSRPRRSSTLKASIPTPTPRIPPPTLRGLVLTSRALTLTARELLLVLRARITTSTTGSRIHTSRVPASITMKLTRITTRRTRIRRILLIIVTRQPLAAPAREIVQQNFARVGPRPLLGAAAAPVPMPRASAYRRYCRVLASHRVARQRTGFAPAALPSTANRLCSALACRIRINCVSMAA